MKKILGFISDKINCCIRKYMVMPLKRKSLKHDDMSIISSTCNGGVVCHDLGLRFNSPTVNLWMEPNDFIDFAKNLGLYISSTIEDITDETGCGYPVGLLGGKVKLYFMHYKSFDEALVKWNERKKRINYKHLFFIMTDRDGCTDDMIEKFDQLPYKNKIIFCSRPYDNLSSVIFCKEYEALECVPILTSWRGISGKRLYDKYFDFVEWFNNGYV